MIKDHLRIIVIITALLTVCACVFHYTRNFNAIIKQLLSDNTGSQHTCIVSSYPITNGNRIKFYAKVTESDCTASIAGRRLYVSAPSDAHDIIEYGNKLKIDCPITVADTSANYGNFDYRQYLMSKNAVGILYINEDSSISIVSEGTGIENALYNLQRKAIFNIHKYFNGDDRALIAAMLTGDNSEFDDELFDRYKIAGIYHIVSVSGLHTGIFISVIAYMLAMLPVKSRRKALITKFASILTSVLLYMFTGYGVSITRVILMTSVTLLCFAARREYNVIVSIVTAAFLILIFTPYQLFSTSFQLSFLSTLGMCIALNIANRKISMPEHGGKIITSIIISLGSTAATAPVCAYSFGAISLLGIAVNIIVIPLATALLVTTVVFSLLSVFLPTQLMLIVRIVPLFLAEAINTAAEFAQKLSFLYISVSLAQIIAVMAAIAAVITVAYFVIKHHYVRSAVFAVLIVAVNLWVLYYGSTTDSENMRVTFINAVKGEATLVTTPRKQNLMFDCGSSTFQSPGDDLFRTYFMHNGVRKIDRLFISYFDDEHTNAVNKLISMGYVEQVVLPPEIQVKQETVSSNRQKVINTADRYKIPVVHLHADSVVDVGDDIHISFAGNNFDLQNKNGCAVYRIEYKNVSFVLSSCLGAKGQTQLTGSTGCTVLKLPNYGAKVGATEQYILSSKPQYAVITAPLRDKYLRVDSSITDVLEKNSIKYARTDINQTITFVTDGNAINDVITRKGTLK
ncbi:MAG: ComEC/Rec2 family competence protein [Clostridia bacterium]|nr:ComEC/Rec2 family competence protein [Clostridia bacterium]